MRFLNSRLERIETCQHVPLEGAGGISRKEEEEEVRTHIKHLHLNKRVSSSHSTVYDLHSRVV